MQDVAHIEAVAVRAPTTLIVTWRDGSTSLVDLAGWIVRGGRRFSALANALVFSGAKVGLYGGNVTWDDDEGYLAIDSEHLRMLAEHQAPFDAAAAARWQEDIKVSNAEAADLIGVVPSTWSSYKAGAAIPATVARLCQVLRSDSTALAAHLRPRTAGNPGGGPVYVVRPLPVDGDRCADLRVGGKTTGFAYLTDAVLAFYDLPDEQQDRATIKVWDGGQVYKASEIRRMHHVPQVDEHSGQGEARTG